MSETVPQEALDMVGKDLVPPLTFEVEKGAIRKLAAQYRNTCNL